MGLFDLFKKKEGPFLKNILEKTSKGIERNNEKANKQDIEEINHIKRLIERRANDGYRFVTVNGTLRDATKKYLRKEGIKVKYKFHDEGFVECASEYYLIKW